MCVHGFQRQHSVERAAERWANRPDMDGERRGVRWGRITNTSLTTTLAVPTV
jgi:hypothetical protein